GPPHPLGAAAIGRGRGDRRLPRHGPDAGRAARRGRMGCPAVRDRWMKRLFVPPRDLEGTRVVVGGDAHRHLARVLRARPGDTVTLFDGIGTEVEAEVARVGARETELTLGTRRAGTAVDPARAITLLVAIARGDRMDLVVQKTTELGVARIVPVV